MSLNFSIGFKSLSFEEQQSMIDSVKEALIEQYKAEAESDFLLRNEYQGQSWQEAFCREYDIDFQLWETDEEANKFDWSFAVEEFAEVEADKKCYEAMKHMEIEVEI